MVTFSSGAERASRDFVAKLTAFFAAELLALFAGEETLVFVHVFFVFTLTSEMLLLGVVGGRCSVVMGGSIAVMSHLVEETRDALFDDGVGRRTG